MYVEVDVLDGVMNYGQVCIMHSNTIAAIRMCLFLTGIIFIFDICN